MLTRKFILCKIVIYTIVLNGNYVNCVKFSAKKYCLFMILSYNIVVYIGH